jgi:hypothetical protein
MIPELKQPSGAGFFKESNTGLKKNLMKVD